MNNRYAQMARRLALIAVAAALAAPAPATGGVGNEQGVSPVIRNDVAHFGRPAAHERPNPYALNDRAHFGNERESPTASTTQDRGRAPIVVRVGGGFDWVSAGVGAAGMLGLTLVVGAGASALRRRNRVGTANA